MCCRCYIEYLKDEELRKLYNLVTDKSDLKTEGEIFPTDNMIVLAKNKENRISPFKMKWGYHIGKNNVFNARVETIDTNVFKDGIENRRCVIPVSNYFEWKKDTKEKLKLKAKESVTYLLGVYRVEGMVPVFSIMTKEATGIMKEIHDRMPLAIKKEDIKTWLLNSNKRSLILENTFKSFEYYSI